MTGMLIRQPSLRWWRLPLGQGELGRPATAALRVQRREPVGVEVVDHFANLILGGDGDFGGLLH